MVPVLKHDISSFFLAEESTIEFGIGKLFSVQF